MNTSFKSNGETNTEKHKQRHIYDDGLFHCSHCGSGRFEESDRMGFIDKDGFKVAHLVYRCAHCRKVYESDYVANAFK